MKITLSELKRIIGEAVKDAKEKMWKEHEQAGGFSSPYNEDKGEKRGVTGLKSGDGDQPKGFQADEALDFSEPLSKTTADGSRYKRQGAANFGPYTAEAPSAAQQNENMLRQAVRNMIAEEFGLKHIPVSKLSVMQPFAARAEVGARGTVGNSADSSWKTTKPSGTVWENLAHWYDMPKIKESRKLKPATEARSRNLTKNRVVKREQKETVKRQKYSGLPESRRRRAARSMRKSRSRVATS